MVHHSCPLGETPSDENGSPEDGCTESTLGRGSEPSQSAARVWADRPIPVAVFNHGPLEGCSVTHE